MLCVCLMLPALYTLRQLHSAAQQEAQRSAIHEATRIRSFLELASWQQTPLRDLVGALSGKLNQRITLINSQGLVLADSHVVAAAVDTMDNHSDRPEVIQALREGSSSQIRPSETLHQQMVYAAVRIQAGSMPAPLEQGGVVRVAMPFAGLRQELDRLTSHWALTLGAAFILSMALALWLTRKLEEPLSAIILRIQTIATQNGQGRLHSSPVREFSRLSEAVNAMAERIENSLAQVECQSAQLETIVDTLEEGLMVIGPQGRIRMANRALSRMFHPGVPPEGKLPVEVTGSAEVQRALDLLLENRKEGGSASLQIETLGRLFLDVRMVRPHPVRHDVQAIIVFYDISELTRLMRVRRDFVANVSHELRTPITAIQGYAETLCSLPPQDAETRNKFLEIIQKNALSMGRLIEDLLVLARLESASLPLNLAPAKLADCAHKAVQACETALAAAGVQAQVLVDPDLSVVADAYYISLVFRNLLENAARYAPRHSAINVSAKQEGHFVRVTVSDSGPGIPPEALPRIFERFYKASRNTAAGANASTGLGLAICKHVVERHGGSIFAYNAPGACIEFTLPASPGMVGNITPTEQSMVNG